MSQPASPYLVRCPECRTRNRIPPARMGSAAKCGRCGASVPTRPALEQPVLVTDANFQEKVLKSPIPVLMFAWAPWCGTCLQVSPIVDAFAHDARGRVRVGKLNLDPNPQLARRYNILSVPQIFVFDNGQLKEELPGALDKHQLMMLMAKYI
ncbi:MAG: thioredoxin domain-containing protein [Desulfobacterales bacterium]